MEKQLKTTSKILISLVTFLTTLFFITYFIIFFKNGGFAYKYRILILLASFILILFNIANIIKCFSITSKKIKIFLIIISVINIIISIIAIYYYFDTPEKYITKENEGIVIYIISYILSVGYLIIEKELTENNLNLTLIDKTNFITFIIILLITFISVIVEKKSYYLNQGMLFIVILTYIIIIKNWNIALTQNKNLILTIIFILISSIIYIISGIVFKHHFETAENYTASTFLNSIAIIFTIISLLINLNDSNKIKNIIELILLSLTIIILFAILKDKATRLEEMKKINIYRILSILTIYLYGIKLEIDYLLKKNKLSIIISLITLILAIVFMIITINKINELYYIFFKIVEINAFIGLFTLIINSIMIFLSSKLNKQVEE